MERRRPHLDRRLSSPSPITLRELLAGGDRRSIAGSQRARRLVERARRRVRDLVELTSDPDGLVRMRALDLLEKLAHAHPSWIQPHRGLFIGPLAESEQWEIHLQIVRTLPLLDWTPRERARVLRILKRDVRHPQSFVSTWALDSLAWFADAAPRLRPAVRRALGRFSRSASKAKQARARAIRRYYAWA